jgi:topoisomerase-4 subunit A
MAYVKKLFDENFLYYASYVIKDRAIPDIEDGLKPVQRRILHSLFEMEDGKFHKVANVVGHCMKYHPHGDQSIYSALVVLANKELFIDRQGNFGNILTGDEASAPRYIECRANALAMDVFYNPKTTSYVDSYDGRNREPVAFPAKLPIVLMMGAEGIAVGMSTKILPHNPLEVIEAEIACLRGKNFELLPDFPTKGLADVSQYADGMGKVGVRARLDTSDPKRIVIRELPFGSTTESLIESIESAAKAGRIKIASISDYTTEDVEIEIKLQRGVYAQEVIDSLYAFTDCETSISCNFLVIDDGLPVQTTVTEVVRRHAKKLLGILKAELQIEEGELLDEIHARTLERIFIEERIYKAIESKRTQEGVQKAVIDGLAPYRKEIGRDVTLEDVERLLKIPIRRISLYDIEKAKAEMERLKARLKEVRKHLAHLTDYAVAWLEGIAKRLGPHWARKTELAGFSLVEAKEAARRDLALRYDGQSGYLGTSVSTGEAKLQVSSFDKVLFIRRSGIWSVVPAPERLFVDQGLLHCAIADKEALADVVFTIVYRDGATGFPCIKRFRIEGWIMNKDYPLLPEGAQVLWFTAEAASPFTVLYEPKPRLKVKREAFRVEDYDVKGIKANGVRLASREVSTVSGPEPAAEPDLFNGVKGSPEPEEQALMTAASKREAATEASMARTPKAERSARPAKTARPAKAAAPSRVAKPEIPAKSAPKHGGLLAAAERAAARDKEGAGSRGKAAAKTSSSKKGRLVPTGKAGRGENAKTAVEKARRGSGTKAASGTGTQKAKASSARKSATAKKGGTKGR